MRRIIVESPYAGDAERNTRYLRACLADCLLRGEAPFVSHGLYTQLCVLNDNDPQQRRLGINTGFAWRAMADATVIYIDLRMTGDMQAVVDHAQDTIDHSIKYRRLGEERSTP